jgi:hypothetical protein
MNKYFNCFSEAFSLIAVRKIHFHVYMKIGSVVDYSVQWLIVSCCRKKKKNGDRSYW